MLKLKKIILFVVALSVVLYISLRKPWIEWDPQNNELVGTEIIFTSDMSVIQLAPAHSEFGYTEEEIEIGNILTSTNSVLYKSLIEMEGEAEPVPYETRFTIESSYMRRYNWLSDGFKGDVRHGVLKDKSNNRAIISFFEFADSNAPHLTETIWTLEEVK